MTIRYPTDAGNSINEATWTAARIATADNIDQGAWEDGVMYIFNTSFTTRGWAHHALVSSSILNSAWDPA